jgi:GNAT superfamily N-acetyltransferase
MTSGLHIAAATERDVPVILQLIKGLADYEKLAHLVTATEDDLRTALFGASPVAEAVIASIDGRPVGYALWFQTFSTFLGRRGVYLEDLFVVPDARGMGVGRALLAHLARIAVERGCERVEWAVLDWNDPAIRFYRRIGAEPMDEWTVYRLTGEALRELVESSA